MKTRPPQSRRIHTADGTVYRVAESPTEQRMREHYQRQYAELIREARSLLWTRAAVHVAFAVPWVICVLWVFSSAIQSGGGNWTTMAALFVTFLAITLHGVSVDMGEKGHGFFGALHHWHESLVTRRAALREECQREFAALEAPRAPDHFAA